MIKVGIAGADSKEAAELLRLCIHHPDVEIISAYAPRRAGEPLSAVHHGFIGEPRILFTSNFDATALDVAFLLTPLYSGADWAKLMADRQELKLVLFPGTEQIAESMSRDPEYGLSEMNRKPLVRGARVAVIPNPVASALLVGLYPLAAHLMIGASLNVALSAPADIITEDKISEAIGEIRRNLQSVQSSFTGEVNFTVSDSGNERAMRLRLTLPLSASAEEVFKIYDSIYDDHNFTFMVNHPVNTAEVEGTHKIIISLRKSSPSELEVDIVADPRMRGGAGEAVHLMNLLCALHEKTGLDLKTSRF